MTVSATSHQPKLFSEKASLGPNTRRLLWRSLLVYFSVAGIGMLLASSSLPSALRVFGLGLVVPGGGFAFWISGGWFDTHLLLMLSSLIAFASSLVLWFATGNALAPPIFWLIAAVAPTLMHHEVLNQAAPKQVLNGILVLGSAVLLFHMLNRYWGQYTRIQKNIMLADTPDFKPQVLHKEASLEDLQRLRLLLDRALQPLDEFNGFEHLDQFQTAALRYQLNFAGYALSLFQAAHAPAFQGYLADAQRNLILKHQDRRIWSYWELESRWGNFDNDADPMSRDNIMFTGFVATQIALYHAASGNRDFDKPGSLTFEHPDGRRFEHDFPNMVETLVRNMKAAPATLFACEPNWVYPLCNGIGAAAIRFQDPKAWAEISEQFENGFEREYLSASGKIVPARSNYLGFALPAVGGAVVQSFPAVFYNGLLPHIALRHWLVERRCMFKKGELNRWRFWPVDFGNYRFSPASGLAATAAAAAEMGDGEVLSHLLKQLDLSCPSVLVDGVSHRPRASLWAHGAELMARNIKPHGFGDLLQQRSPAETRPFIARAKYPDVLIASAFATLASLHVVLYPGRASGLQTIGVSGLSPGATYRVGDKDYFSSDEGTLDLELNLQGRTELHLELRS
jgi:hypothetical protein